MLDRKMLRNLDWSLYIAVIMISLLGILMITSASQNNEFGDPSFYMRKQIIWVVLGHICLLAALYFDYSIWFEVSSFIYAANLVLLVSVLLLGVSGGGAQRWIALGGFRLQPSEFAKIAVAITLATQISKLGKIDSFWKMFICSLHVLVPMSLILIQPDLGTSLVFVVILVAVMYSAGLTTNLLSLMILGASALAPVVWIFGLKGYQRDRLTIFLDPSKDRTGIGYQLMQSIIAVGSGMFAGQGLFNGTQSRLNFLPEQHTDFIFSVVGEELGFIGSILLVLGFFFIIYRIFMIALSAKDAFGRYFAIAIGSFLAFQVIVNIGMTVGVMPITGLPLPFFSAGGSSYLA
ncbi:MAG: rod shape-determining protein RodA, partial [bacterium]|nr:rod shape-determining protein RodA [bacterium]